MFGKILFISDNVAHIQNISGSEVNADLMNLHIIFESPNQRVLGEITEINPDVIKVRFLGEYQNDHFINGVLRKPLLNSKIRIINSNELMDLVGTVNDKSFILGESAIYKGFKICPVINSMFSNHLAIFGNSGSGKSYGVARIIQNLFNNQYIDAINANLFIFDSFGEYKTAFKNINELNNKYNYKFITTNRMEPSDYALEIPINLMNGDDFALLLQAGVHSQLPIINHTIKLAKIFSLENEDADKYKNHLIAKALIAILFSNETTASKKNEIFTIIEVCHTKDFNFDTVIPGVGYTRSFSECFEIDSNGYFGESVLITDYILKHINDDIEKIKEPENASYDLKDFQKALDFTLISEGFQHNDTLHDDSVILKVRLNSIVNSRINDFFIKDNYKIGDYLKKLLLAGDKRAQIINVNLEDIDDVYAKVIVKIMSRILFEYAKKEDNRASIPFHLFLEEAHRYVQNDNDTFLFGYNIFDRIAKEGRKYGIILDIITQRPVEMSDTVIAQCSNFLIFKMTHPKDIKYIEEMLPNISQDIIEKQKTLQPGNCVAFGSAFKIPMIVKLELPNPEPYSSNCNVSSTWKGK